MNGRFVLDAGALEAAWNPAVKALILSTPWKPVGTVMTPQELSGIQAFCRRRGVDLISDEIYEAITYEGHRHTSPRAAVLINR